MLIVVDMLMLFRCLRVALIVKSVAAHLGFKLESLQLVSGVGFLFVPSDCLYPDALRSFPLRSEPPIFLA